jgi:hypothetical protein
MKPMQTNFGLAVMVKTDNPTKGSVIHLALYESYPSQADVDALIQELRTDPEFGMTDLVIDETYFLQDIGGDELQEIKKNFGIPDVLEDDIITDNGVNTVVHD